jgi:osmotically inducible protein OsmC
MPARKAEAKWNGNLREGSGTLSLESGAYNGPYDFRSRFEQGGATNPEELLGAAHAGCFTMAMTAALTRENITATSLHTTATVHLESTSAGPTVTKIELVTRGQVPGIDQAKFEQVAQGAKQNCAISRALASVATITLDAKLEG